MALQDVHAAFPLLARGEKVLRPAAECLFFWLYRGLAPNRHGSHTLIHRLSQVLSGSEFISGVSVAASATLPWVGNEVLLPAMLPGGQEADCRVILCSTAYLGEFRAQGVAQLFSLLLSPSHAHTHTNHISPSSLRSFHLTFASLKASSAQPYPELFPEQEQTDTILLQRFIQLQS